MACTGLYIHVPFCERKCPYCDFYSLPADNETMALYTEAIIRALRTQPFGITSLDTIYFGGGTPSVLGGRRIAKILEAVRSNFSVAKDAEITVECNPHSALEQELRPMQAAGVNRISLGMQSADDRQLQTLGRLHTVQDVSDAVKAAQRCGIEHLSLDLMLATPGQTLPDIGKAAAFCASLGAEHVSAYLLKIEEGTPFAQNGIASRCYSEDEQADAYLYAVEALGKYGYEQYEISNFAHNGQVARHNLKYWNCEEYLGLGPSAHSFVGGRRFFFPRDLASFLATDDPYSLLVPDGVGGDAEEYIMLRSRLTEGIRWSQLQKRYPDYNLRPLQTKAAFLAKNDLVLLDENGFRLTLNGFLLSNAVIGELLG